MKNLIIILFVFAAIGCGSGSGGRQTVNIPPGSDFRADMSIRNGSAGREIEVMFYISTPTVSGAKNAPPKQVITVEDPTYNGAPMMPMTGPTGTQMYKADPAKWAPESVIAAKLNGKLYEGKSARDAAPGNTLAAVTLMPKE